MWAVIVWDIIICSGIQVMRDWEQARLLALAQLLTSFGVAGNEWDLLCRPLQTPLSWSFQFSHFNWW